MRSIDGPGIPLQELESTTRWTKIPDELLSILTPREHMLIHLYLSYRWTPDATIRPFLATIRRRLGWSIRTIQRTTRSLEEMGFLIREPQYRESDGGQSSNIYRPGPLLLPYLACADDEHDTDAGQSNHPPVTARSDKRKDRNQRPERRDLNGRYTPPTMSGSLLETRYHGRIRRE